MTKAELLAQIDKLQRRWKYHAVEHRARRESNSPSYDAYEHGVATGYLKALNSFSDWARRLETGEDTGWRSVKESLPPMDEEVIVLLADNGEVRIDPIYEIAVGHIVNKEYCIDFNGWNIPGVRFWMPMPEIPKEK